MSAPVAPGKPIRLDSLDALRGLDMVILVLLHPFILALAAATPDCALTQFLGAQSTHVAWQGFTVHDLIMPLFMFVAGVAIPFSFAKYRQPGGGFRFDRRKIYGRMARRVALLWLLGMVMQGNLLGLDPHRLAFFSNTLQAIAIGYLFASLFYVGFSGRVQAVIAVGLMLFYWAVMTFCSADGFGAGSYAPDSNMAELIDRVVLGRFRDGVSWSDGVWSFAPWYRYTWILSTATFIVTVMSGVFAGEILLKNPHPGRAFRGLLIFGVALLVGAWVLSYRIPIIKTIWTPSMVLLSSGISVLLLAVLYYIMDCRGWKRWAFPLRVMGMNAIVAYFIGEFFNFTPITGRLVYGLEQFTGSFYPVVVAAANGLLIYWIIWMLYRCGKFIKL